LNETRDDTHPLGAGGELDPVAVARVVRKVLVIVTPAIVALIAAVWGAIHAVAGDAAARANGVEKQASAEVRGNYDVTRKATAERDRVMADHEQRLRRLEAQQHPPARVGSRPRAPAAPAPVVPPKPLPATLDQALKQVQAPASPPAPTKDGGP